MKKVDIEIGGIYSAKVSGTVQAVRIVRESQYGGWNAVNIKTKREVRIRSAARLRNRLYSTSLNGERTFVTIPASEAL